MARSADIHLAARREGRPNEDAPPIIGGGEMGRLIRETDWSPTPLGAYATWPQSLRSALSMVLNAKGIAALYWGPEQWLLYNDAYGEALGERHPRAFGRPMPQVLPDLAPVLAPQVAAVLGTGEGFAIENMPLTMRRHGRDEETAWTYSFSPVQGEAGGFAGVLLLATEMTRQTAAERSVGQVTSRLETALQVARLGTYDWQPTTGVIDIDARGREMFGLPADGVLTEADTFGRIVPDDVDRVRAEASAAMGLDQPFDPRNLSRIHDYTYDLVRPDGSRRSILSSGAILENPDGTLRMVGTFNDVTELRQAERQLRAQNAGLEQQVAERTQDRNIIWQVSRDLLAVTDAEGRLLRVNPAWTRVLGWSEHDLIGRTSEWLEHPDDRTKTRDATIELAERKIDITIENRIRAVDGSYRTLAWTAVPVDGQFYCSGRDVTEERARAAAQTDAERVRLALEAGAIIGTWFWDLATDHFTVDEAFATTFGLDPALGREAVPLVRILAPVHPDDQPGIMEAIDRAITGDGRYEYQYRVRHRNGRYCWVQAYGHVVRAPDGTPLTFPGVLLDIGTRRYDTAFSELSERLRTLATPEEMAQAAARTVGESLDLSRVAYGDIDTSGERITLGLNWLAEGQRSIDGVVEFSAFGSFNENLRRGEDVIIDDIKTDPRTAAHADSFVPIDIGSLVNLPLMEQGRLKVVFCLNQSRPHAWSAVEVNFARRVMDRTEVEIARRKAEGNLREMNLSLERLIEERTQERNKIWQTSRDMLLVSDEAGVWLSVNPAWTETLGWSPDELVGRTSEWLEHPDDRAKTRAEIGRLAEGETTLRFENRFRTREGDYRTLVWSAVPDGNRFYCVARDVTAERDQSAALTLAEDALRQSQKMEAVGQLTGGVAHDFNNLLTVIKSSSDLLKRPDLAQERRARYVAAISDTVDRAAKLTGQLLAFARRQALKPEVFAVGDSVRGLADMMGTLTGSRVRITTDLSDAPCYVNADASQFDTALVNLAVNARDAMDGEGRIHIAVRSIDAIPAIRTHPEVKGAYVAVSLGDTGSGIPPDLLDRIFEPFFTTKEVGKGTGLGLSQVFGFAKQSGGDTTVTSTTGTGTTFTIYLPRVAAPERVNATEEVVDRMDGGGLCVLVVEDNVDVGTFAVQTLSDLGFTSVLAADGTAALARLAEDANRFDVVFSDVMMPGMSGIELGQEIRRLHQDLPVVLASGYSHVLARNGTYGFELLHKPYSVEQLSQVLRKAASCQRRKRLP